MSLHQLPPRKPAFDVAKRYVRFRELRDDGYVSFAFAIGDPELMVELILPLPDYQAFCREQRVIYLTRDPAAALDHEQAMSRKPQPGSQE